MGSWVLHLPPVPEVEGGFLWVLAFDPGVTTGWAVFRVPRIRLLEKGFLEAIRPGCGGAWNAGDFVLDTEDDMVDRMLEIARCVYEEVDVHSGDEWSILVEDFRVRMVDFRASFLSPVRLGAMFRRDMRRGAVLVEFRTSSDALAVVTDGRLRDWNLWRPGSVHARDAMRHAILTCRRYSSEPILRKMVRRKMAG